MLKNFSLTVFTFLLVSCSGDIESYKLLKYSDSNKKYQIDVIEREYNENDSLVFEKKNLTIFDSKNRIININNSQFYFYNIHNKLTDEKSIYRRGWKTNILRHTYIYDKDGKLRFETFQINSQIDTTGIYKYNNFNQLIEIKNPNLIKKFSYQEKKISEEIEIIDDEISKKSIFTYDLKDNKIIDNWICNVSQKMKTYFKYNSKNKLISKRDSCITVFGNPNEFVEYLDQYFYDKNDSIIEKKMFGRVLSEKEFKIRSKTRYLYKKTVF
ncbi:hypothetical protein NG800_014250 [Epilithonimonas ginsengisoli]|uniref:DUF4595 domain-containing protein n=1 Tax=Epilithonimonas ginsengisoli TaxID=1245592 RepID=A0ABU4JK49_9FLAO|nr:MULTISPECIES: hypothetical protein [Chryseobacterium group]MBV6881161.1 hypothetical protein [Epilithonimonas sp. FP105]MDW8550084.1 hypothetical protein [Epilithonimonas ginsengisoli]OAH71884.1 hypothetical protein AXA65_11140 [Chryseobacterium sp. FP211-J200]